MVLMHEANGAGDKWKRLQYVTDPFYYSVWIFAGFPGIKLHNIGWLTIIKKP